jgi:hypothetical protein
MNTIKQQIDNAIAYMQTNGYNKAHIVGSMWLVIIDEHHAHLTSNGNVYGTVSLGALK